MFSLSADKWLPACGGTNGVLEPASVLPVSVWLCGSSSVHWPLLSMLPICAIGSICNVMSRHRNNDMIFSFNIRVAKIADSFTPVKAFLIVIKILIKKPAVIAGFPFMHNKVCQTMFDRSWLNVQSAAHAYHLPCYIAAHIAGQVQGTVGYFAGTGKTS